MYGYWVKAIHNRRINSLLFNTELYFHDKIATTYSDTFQMLFKELLESRLHHTRLSSFSDVPDILFLGPKSNKCRANVQQISGSRYLHNSWVTKVGKITNTHLQFALKFYPQPYIVISRQFKYQPAF